LFKQPNFRRFFAGYATSLFGTGMAPVAVSFAVLEDGRSASELGFVLTAVIATTIAGLLVGGVLADRFGRRRLMLGSDVLRCVAQGAFAALVIVGHAPLWSLIGVIAVSGLGSGLFSPALTALTREIVSEEEVHDANALIGLARNIGSVGGPAVAGALVAVTNAGVVVAIDAVTYAVSVVSLAMLELDHGGDGRVGSMLDDLREGWDAWRSRAWIWITDIKFALSNAIVLSPWFVLGPAIAKRHLGGATPWGLVLTAQGAGAIVAGLALVGRRSSRPLVLATVLQAAWALPLIGLALLLPAWAIAVGAFAAGIGSATFTATWTTTLQRNVPQAVLARVSSYDSLTAFALGPIGLALAGPIAASVGDATLLWIGAGWQLLSTLVMLALPQIRRFRDAPRPGLETG
jgi:MFS family permease